MDIKKLINNNKWNKIYKLIKQNKFDYDLEIINGNSIAHLASINNNSKIINHFLNYDNEILIKSNNEGNSCIHLLAIYGYTQLLEKCINSNENFIYLMNDNNESILNILYNDFNFIKLILKNHSNNNLIIDDVNGENVLTKNILESNKNNDLNFKIVKLLLKYQKKYIDEYYDSFLCFSIRENKNHITDLFIKNNYDVNKKDTSFYTPFLYTVKNRLYDLAVELIEHNADINYVGPEGDQNPLIWSIINDDEIMINILLEYDFDVNKFNRFIETPLHFALGKNNNLLHSTIAKLIYCGNLNIKNVYGETPLHLLCKFHNWKNYSNIIKKKKLDIFICDNVNKRPIDYLLNDSIYDFIDIVLSSYAKLIGKKNFRNAFNYNKICRLNFKSQKCKHEIKKYIFQTKRSIPIKNDNEIILQKIKMINGDYMNYGLFNSDTLHSMIYSIQILRKYKNIGIPFQYFINDKFVNDRILLNNNDLFMSPSEFVVSDLVKIYTDYFYEILPYLILWRSESQFFVHNDLKFLIKKCIESNFIRFIFLKLTLITSPNNTHANIIIYDKKYNILERFEPYGKIPYLDNDKLDYFIENKIGKECLNKNLTYLSSNDLFGNIGVQTISNDNKQYIKKLGDPYGYCLAWTIWYLELRISNENIHPKKLLGQAINNIINKNDSSGERKFINFIRNYSSRLDKIKNEFLLEAGINQTNLYNLMLSMEDQNKVVEKLILEFNKIIQERY